jgi:protein-disulfide isomerase
MVLGSPDAPLTIIEYSSFTCPHCATFHTETLPAIKERYIDTGKVRMIFREAYFDQYGLWASMLARCSGEDAFFGYVDTLFAKQTEWARAENIVAELQRIGRLGGMPAERIQECLSDEEFMRDLVAGYQEKAAADELRATPSFKFGDGALVSGAMGVEAFSQLIEDNL